MTHWAAHLVGKPWQLGATGPDAFDCWGLVRHVFAIRFDVDMPESAAGVLNLKAAALASGWKPAHRAHLLPDDIVLMRDGRGARHVGVATFANGRLGVLHADGHLDKTLGPVGCVGFTTLSDLAASGCTEFEFWSRKE